MENGKKKIISFDDRFNGIKKLHVLPEEPDDHEVNVANSAYFSGIFVRADGSVINYIQKPPPKVEFR